MKRTFALQVFIMGLAAGKLATCGSVWLQPELTKRVHVGVGEGTKCPQPDLQLGGFAI